jgi:type I restriction enzyme S subunit
VRKEYLKIRDFCEVFDGPHATPTKTDEGPFYLSISSLYRGTLDLSKSAHLSEQEFQKWTKRVTPRKGDLLFSYETRLGEAALMPDGVKACLGRRMGILRPDTKKVLPEYLLYSYIAPEFQNVISSNTITGATVDRLSLTDFPNFEMRIPQLDQQRHIVAILSALDAKIALNHRINLELEGMAKLLYDYWFVQYDFPLSAAQAAALGKPRLTGKPYRTSGGPMVYHEQLKREIPKGWGAAPLGKVVSKIIDHRGKTPTKLGGEWSENPDDIIALSAKHVKNGTLVDLQRANRVSPALYEKWMPEKLTDGDVLMTSEAPAGEFYFIHGDFKYCLSQRLFALRASTDIVLPSYFYNEISRGHSYSEIMGSLSGSTVFGIRQDVLRSILVMIPDIEIQKQFNIIYLPWIAQIRNLEQQNQELTTLRDWLLPMLMNGQVRVS